jgi:hypothetical protein
MAQCPVGVSESGGQRGESAGTTYFQDAVDSGKGISIGGISISRICFLRVSHQQLDNTAELRSQHS